MTKRIVTVLGVVALAAQMFAFGCSSSGGKAGTGGSTGVGTGGAGGGVGGSTGTDGGTMSPIGAQCVNIKNKDACTGTEAPCWNTCGPNKAGFKNCTCAAGIWNCPVCAYDPSHDFSCYKITATVALCPPDPTDAVGMLPISGGACTQDACKPCGSATAFAYRDSSNAPKAGYCVCVPPPADADAGTGSKYSCASIKEWAPQ